MMYFDYYACCTFTVLALLAILTVLTMLAAEVLALLAVLSGLGPISLLAAIFICSIFVCLHIYQSHNKAHLNLNLNNKH